MQPKQAPGSNGLCSQRKLSLIKRRARFHPFITTQLPCASLNATACDTCVAGIRRRRSSAACVTLVKARQHESRGSTLLSS